jgi:hypothetical protein
MRPRFSRGPWPPGVLRVVLGLFFHRPWILFQELESPQAVEAAQASGASNAGAFPPWSAVAPATAVELETAAASRRTPRPAAEASV